MLWRIFLTFATLLVSYEPFVPMGKKKETMGTIILLVTPQAEFQLSTFSFKLKVSFQSFFKRLLPFSNHISGASFSLIYTY